MSSRDIDLSSIRDFFTVLLASLLKNFLRLIKQGYDRFFLLVFLHGVLLLNTILDPYLG